MITTATNTLRAGGIVAYPTEAVFGLGCDPNNTQALQRLLALKQRDPNKGLILVVSCWQQAELFIQPLTDIVRKKISQPCSTPITWVLPSSTSTNKLVTGVHASVAIRCSNHPTVVALCNAFNGAIVSTSANVQGNAAATTLVEAKNIFADKVDCYLTGNVGSSSSPSEIRDALTNNVIRPHI